MAQAQDKENITTSANDDVDVFSSPIIQHEPAHTHTFKVCGYEEPKDTGHSIFRHALPNASLRAIAKHGSVASFDTFHAPKATATVSPASAPCGASADEQDEDDYEILDPHFDELCAANPGTFVGDGYPRIAPNPDYLRRMEELGHRRVLYAAPDITRAKSALSDLQRLLRGEKRGPNSKGYKPVEFDNYVRVRLEGMRNMLALYTNPKADTYEKWKEAAVRAASLIGGDTGCGRRLAELSRAFIEDREIRPINPYGKWATTRLSDEGLLIEMSHRTRALEGTLGGITAEKFMQVMNSKEILEKYELDGVISIRTARRYLTFMGFSYSHTLKGQYSDGHDREDVVQYRNEVFLPTMQGYEERSWTYHADGTIEVVGLSPGIRAVVVWYHDESIFYAHDRQRRTWQLRNGSAKPYQKGDGGGFMVADYVSANFGWLRGPNGETARKTMRPGKNKDGYFTSEGIEEQATIACTIATERWPEFDHVFVYDNATTHRKRSAGALSATGMPKFTSGSRAEDEEEELDEHGVPKPKKPKKKRAPPKPKPVDPSKPPRRQRKPRGPLKDPKDANFLVSVNKRNADGSLSHDEHGRLAKEEIRMTGAVFANGDAQELYFPDDAERYPGKFKGMAVILEERRVRGDLGSDLTKEALAAKVAQCKGFKCPATEPGVSTRCCLRRMLYNEPDFTNVKSCLESACAAFGVEVLFLPRFHPELNPIEMVWGFAKRIYRDYPPSSNEDILEQNTLKALDAVPLTTIRRFVMRALRFGEAYRLGLTGAEAAWATRKYRGHRLLPPDFRIALAAEYENATKNDRVELRPGAAVEVPRAPAFFESVEYQNATRNHRTELGSLFQDITVVELSSPPVLVL
ncbi:hypothetical protein MKEN_00281700 [Mycena kentingensis (nom. inval.)]|nr:hypothetical protein MKEN_00281700 [Mycena kentingensis (nom. inval.)]